MKRRGNKKPKGLLAGGANFGLGTTPAVKHFNKRSKFTLLSKKQSEAQHNKRADADQKKPKGLLAGGANFGLGTTPAVKHFNKRSKFTLLSKKQSEEQYNKRVKADDKKRREKYGIEVKMLDIELLKEKRELDNYFEDIFDFIGENFEQDDQAVLESFIDKILEDNELTIYQKMQAINDGINQSLNQEYTPMRYGSGKMNRVQGKIKNKYSEATMQDNAAASITAKKKKKFGLF